MHDRHWLNLVAAIRHGDCILVLGPELPADAIDGTGGASPENAACELTEMLAAELNDERHTVTGTTLAAVAQQYEDTKDFGPNLLRVRAEKVLLSGRFAPSRIHAALAALPFSVIVTTCQDDLMERALVTAGKVPFSERYDFRGSGLDNLEFRPPTSPRAPLVYHLFGTAKEPSSLVLSENDILDFLISIAADRPPMPSSMRRILRKERQSFLFVGFGITQWCLRVLVKVLVRSLEVHRTEGNTFATEPLRGLTESDREETILFYQRGTRVEVEDAESAAFLTTLNERIAAEGGVVERPASTQSRLRVFISYAREDIDLASRIFHTLKDNDFQPWWDMDSLSAGESWEERVRDELGSTDFTVVLYTPALCRKVDGFVNNEIHLARHRGRNVRGSFVIPLRTDDVSPTNVLGELSEYNQMLLRRCHFDEDIGQVMRHMVRESQRRASS